MLLVYILMAIHIEHWYLAGKTLAPLELDEVIYTLELGIVTEPPRTPGGRPIRPRATRVFFGQTGPPRRREAGIRCSIELDRSREFLKFQTPGDGLSD